MKKLFTPQSLSSKEKNSSLSTTTLKSVEKKEQLRNGLDPKHALITALTPVILAACGSSSVPSGPTKPTKTEYSAVILSDQQMNAMSTVKQQNAVNSYELDIDENTTYVMGIVRDGFVAGNEQFSVTNVQNGETLPDNFCQKSSSGEAIGIGKINVSAAPSIPGNKNFPASFSLSVTEGGKSYATGGKLAAVSANKNIVAYVPESMLPLSNENQEMVTVLVDMYDKAVNFVYTTTGWLYPETHPYFPFGGVALMFYEGNSGYMSSAANTISLNSSTIKDFVSKKEDLLFDAIHEINHSVAYNAEKTSIVSKNAGIKQIWRGLFNEGGAEAGASIGSFEWLAYSSPVNEHVTNYLKNVSNTPLSKDFNYTTGVIDSYGGTAMLNLVIQDYYNKTKFSGKSLLSGYQHLARKAHDKKENFFVDIKNETGKDMQDRVEEMGKVLLTDGKDCVVNGIDTPLFDITKLANGAVKLQQLTNGNTNSPAELWLYKLPFSASPTKVTLSLPEGVTAVLMKVERKKVESK